MKPNLTAALLLSMLLGSALAQDMSFFQLARDGTIDAVRAALARGVNVNDRDEYGQTPLMYAAGSNTLAVVAELVQGGAAVDETSHAGWTPLMYAVRDNPDFGVIKYLVMLSKSLSARNGGGETALDIARQVNPEATSFIEQFLAGKEQQRINHEQAQQRAEESRAARGSNTGPRSSSIRVPNTFHELPSYELNDSITMTLYQAFAREYDLSCSQHKGYYTRVSSFEQGDQRVSEFFRLFANRYGIVDRYGPTNSGHTMYLLGDQGTSYVFIYIYSPGSQYYVPAGSPYYVHVFGPCR
jgi:hypothetical protein